MFQITISHIIRTITLCVYSLHSQSFQRTTLRLPTCIKYPRSLRRSLSPCRYSTRSEIAHHSNRFSAAGLAYTRSYLLNAPADCSDYCCCSAADPACARSIWSLSCFDRFLTGAGPTYWSHRCSPLVVSQVHTPLLSLKP